MRTVLLGIATLVIAWLVAAPGARACEPSAGGARSFDTRVSPLAGGVCLHTLTLYEGATCDEAHRIAVETVACGTTRRLVVLDDGTFVSIGAPRTSHRDWAIVTVFTIGDGARRADVALDDLPDAAPLRGTVRVSFDAAALLFRDREREIRIALSVLAARLD